MRYSIVDLVRVGIVVVCGLLSCTCGLGKRDGQQPAEATGTSTPNSTSPLWFSFRPAWGGQPRGDAARDTSAWVAFANGNFCLRVVAAGAAPESDCTANSGVWCRGRLSQLAIGKLETLLSEENLSLLAPGGTRRRVHAGGIETRLEVAGLRAELAKPRDPQKFYRVRSALLLFGESPTTLNEHTRETIQELLELRDQAAATNSCTLLAR